jgi:hypothetical protein
VIRFESAAVCLILLTLGSFLKRIRMKEIEREREREGGEREGDRERDRERERGRERRRAKQKGVRRREGDEYIKINIRTIIHICFFKLLFPNPQKQCFFPLVLVMDPSKCAIV